MKLIVIEGIDASGKSTQTSLLKRNLEKSGRKVEVVDFPQYGNWSAVFVEKYLNGEMGAINEVSAYQASMFYALDRFAMKPKLKKLIESDTIVIANRYVTSNICFQGAKLEGENRKEFIEWLSKLEYDILGLPRPDIVVYLKMPIELSKRLLEKRMERKYIKSGNKDLHEKDMEYMRKVQAVYDELSREWVNIECGFGEQILAKEDVQEKILEEVNKRI